MANYKLTHTGPEVDAAVTASLAGYTPKGTYASLAALTAAIPAGNSNVYLTADNGYWNYWNGAVWTAGGPYSGAGASVAIGTTTTGEVGIDASVTNSGTSKDAVFNFTIPRGATGAQGPKGDPGQKGDTGATGQKGDPGADFTVKGIYATLGDLQTAHPTGAAGDAYAVGTSESNTVYVWDVAAAQWKDVGSLKGPKGDPGKGVASIIRTSGTGAPGTTDTYTITYSDSTTTTFNVYNGADGTGTGDMLKSVYDPNSKNADAFLLSNMVGDATHRIVSDAEKAAWNEKQSALTFDSTPTASSTNPVTSGGIKTAMDAQIGRSTKVTEADTNYASYMARGEALASADTTPTQNGQICWKYQ